MDNRKIIKQYLLSSIIHIVVSLVAAFIFALPLKYLWNWLLPHLFNFSTINLIEAFGLVFLSRILFATTQRVTKDKTEKEI